MKEKILAIIFALVMIILAGKSWYGFIASYFFKIELASSTQLKFKKISESEVEVTGYDLGLEGTLKIPKKILIGLDVYTVAGIGDVAFNGCKGLKSIKIPKSVSSIGYSAFQTFTAIKCYISNTSNSINI